MTKTTYEVFVLMPFEKRFHNVYQLVIKPLTDKCGVNINRADDLPFANQQIYDTIVGAIDRADIILADLSDNNPNVFYEMGYAHARGKIVIPISNSDRLPFDVAGFPTIFYDNTDLLSLSHALENRLLDALKLCRTRETETKDRFILEYNRELKQFEKFALEKAKKAGWTRPGMYFTEKEVVAEIEVEHDIAYRLLSALREMGRITCVNWKGEPVWMASLTTTQTKILSILADGPAAFSRIRYLLRELYGSETRAEAVRQLLDDLVSGNIVQHTTKGEYELTQKGYQLMEGTTF